MLNAFRPVAESEVEKLLKRASNKSNSLDFLPTSLLRECSEVFVPIITRLANLAFVEGKFPDNLKSAVVTPLIKKPNLNRDDPANFRPISNLNTIGKLLERLILNRLQPHLAKSPCFNRYQSAYRTGHSTETALLRITDNVLRAIDNKRATILVELDLSAAFDMIDHQLLIRRLELSYGVSGTALDLVNSYLHGRSQVVNVNGQCSPSAQCVIGVPQGSVLGPLLFSAFISPIANVTKSFGVEQHQYADDTSLFITVSRDDRVTQVQRLSECTLEVQSWFTLNGMALNPDKSEVLHMCPIRHHRANTGIDTLAVGGVEIKLATKVKLLGVTLDEHLNLNEHVKTVCGNAMYHIRALRHIRRSITEECANTIACSVVSSRIDYCNSIFTGMSSFNVGALQRVQNFAARVVSGVGRSEHITEHLRKLHWLPVRHRIDFKVATISFKAIRSSEPDYLRDALEPYTPVRELRSASNDLLVCPRARTVTAERAFSIAAPKLWNTLPPFVKSADNLSVFKTRLKTFLFRKAFDS